MINFTKILSSVSSQARFIYNEAQKHPRIATIAAIAAIIGTGYYLRQTVKTLALNNNQIPSESDSLARLPRSYTVDLVGNSLSEAEIRLFTRLPRTHSVDLVGNPHSEAEILRFIGVRDAQRLADPRLGPEIRFSIHDKHELSSSLTLTEELALWKKEAYSKLIDLPASNTIRDFLVKMRATEDYKKNKNEVIQEVCNMLQFACDDDKLREKIIPIMEACLGENPHCTQTGFLNINIQINSRILQKHLKYEDEDGEFISIRRGNTFI